ncbi:nucleoside hydrolase-like domain-containing protein [Novipirellula sp. SH528]|uniref:DUF1593 domain-containing protein n=1 Tax=Novipirellula sp. SH528 TaxID=3454466 RepID=UPI003FA099FB
MIYRKIAVISATVCVAILCLSPVRATDSQRLRVIVETDIGGDADDQASLVRFLLYSNEWDVEGIIADRPANKFHSDPVRNHKGIKANNGYELLLGYLDAYALVYDSLRRHAQNYPEPASLRHLAVPGWNDSDLGVDLLIAAADRDDTRPIWYGNWGSNSGSISNLRRAFDKVKQERSAAEYEAFVGKFRICTLDGPGRTRQGHEDLIPLHIETGYPDIGGRWYHRFRPLTEHAGGFDVRRDVQENHGPLGTLYTTPKEGDSWTFVYLIPTGLSDPNEPTWGGWAGRYGPRGGDSLNNAGPNGTPFFWANQQDAVNGKTSRDNTASRWAEHMQNDFRARLDWCVTKDFTDANHAPIIHCQNDDTAAVLRVGAAVGSELTLDASGTTDPDGDELSYRWFVYAEPGTYRGEAILKESTASKATFEVPTNARGKSLHIVLQVTDSGTPPLTRYRRIVIEFR